VTRSAVEQATRGAPDEVALLQRLRSGDEAAFAEVVDRWSPAMLRAAVLQTRSRAVAEEVVQDTWLAVLQGLDGFEGRSSLRTWVFRILLYTSRSRAERERRVLPLTDVAPADGGAVLADGEAFLPRTDPRWPGHWSHPPRAWTRRPDEALLGGELRAVLTRAVEALPARQRAVLVLRDVEGFDAAEVCGLLDLEPGNQRVLLHRARTAVRAALTPYLAEEAS
jgi:RNA polymerase sigma-70 factor, ECF subfamily